MSLHNTQQHPSTPGTAANPPVAARQGWPYIDKDDPWSSHSRIRTWLAELPAGTTILDVGAATGTLGRMCAGRGLIVHGIEPNAAWAEQARPAYDALVCGMLDDAPDQFLAGHDVVVCADVIEHMAQPEAALRRLLALQPAGCRCIISVPNVANIWVRLNLLAGRFEYTDRGILDRTHLRFFTQRSFGAFLAAVGLRPTRFEVTPIPLNLVHPLFQRTRWGRALHAGLDRLTHAWPALLGYQFIVQAVKQ